MNLKKVYIENCMCFYFDFDNIIKVEDFNFNNILIDEKSYENILVHNISYKTLMQNQCVLGSIK